MNSKIDLEDIKLVSTVKYLHEKLGGKWKYAGHDSWECDDGKRVVRNCVILGGYTGDDVVGSQLYLYQKDGPSLPVY